MTHVPYPGCYCADCVEGAEPIGYINAEMLNRKGEFEANGMVLFDCPCGAATMPLYAEPPSARITGDKDRSVQSRAPTQRIIILTEANRQLAIECHRLRGVLHWIAEAAYMDHHSGNQNVEYLQSVARDGLAQGMSAEGQDLKGLGATPASPVAESDAPETKDNHHEG